MNRINRIIALTSLAAALSFGLAACSGDADVDVTTDSVDNVGPDGHNDVDANGGVNVDTAGGIDVNADSAQGSADGEGIEKLVEAKLIASPGFSGVDVESAGEGNIILNGTVASEEEKMRAESETKSVSGVTNVTNNLTVQAAK